MARRWLALMALGLMPGDCAGAVNEARPIETTHAACAVGERPGYFVPGPPDGPLALLGCARLGVSGKRIEFSANLADIDGDRHACVNPAYSGRGQRGFFIPALCELEPPLSRFAVRDARQPRQGVRGYAYVIWGTAVASTAVAAHFTGGTAQAAVMRVDRDLARRFGESPFSLFVVELPTSAACAAVTVVGNDTERIPPRPRLCDRAPRATMVPGMEDGGVIRRSHDVDYAKPLSEADVRKGSHRRRVGGQWDEVGDLQLEFMIAQGLRPEHRLLDVGCGALRGGVRFVDYLQSGGYYGIDINQSLLDAGFEHELPDRLRSKLPREHLRATDRFDCDFGVQFDFAIAQSLFTHLSLNQIRLCLFRVAKVMPPGARLLASYFEAPRSHPLEESCADGRLWTERDAFFYYREDLRFAARASPWKLRYIGAWGHPRHQRMVEFRRIEKPLRTPRDRLERAARRAAAPVTRRLRRHSTQGRRVGRGESRTANG